MLRLSISLLFTAYLIVIKNVLSDPLDFDDQNLDHYCSLCSCNEDGTIVDCSNRGLVDIPDGMNNQIEKLNISYNEITTYPYKLQELTNLVTLDLSRNLLRTLPGDAFQNLTNLEVLNLSNNQFENWVSLNPNEVLRPVTNLKTLNLSHNKLNTLTNLSSIELFVSASLEILILENCDINAVSGRSPLGGLTAIRILKLSRNPIRRFQGLVSPSLKSVDMSHAQLFHINHNELRFLPSLIHLQLNHNNRLVLSNSVNTLTSESLRYLDISYCNLMHHSLEGFPNLRKVVLSHNMIRSLGSREFMNNTKLEYLDLANNNIASITSDTFNGLTLLKYLDLSWNELSTIPEESLLKMPALTQINLSRNYITNVGHLKSPSLLVLDMNSCEIVTIGKDSLEGLENLVDINLSRNLISSLPESFSSDTLKYLNLNYNRISRVSNLTFYMLPRLTILSVIGNRFTTIWNRTYFDNNAYLERIDLDDNTWRCDCTEEMYDFYEFLTLSPSSSDVKSLFKREEIYNLRCSSPREIAELTWLEACFLTWFPGEKQANLNNVTWFIICMIVGLALCFVIVTVIKKFTKRRLRGIQEDRERRVEQARERLRQMHLRAEQEAQINAPDPRDLISPPSYDEALTMPKLSTSSHSLCETGSGKSRRRRGRRKTKSSGDLLDETERNGDVPVNALELTEGSHSNGNRRRRRRKYGSQEIQELDQSPRTRRKRRSYSVVEDTEDSDGIITEIEADVQTPLRSVESRRNSNVEIIRESDL